jgi:hypothetical protein
MPGEANRTKKLLINRPLAAISHGVLNGGPVLSLQVPVGGMEQNND